MVFSWYSILNWKRMRGLVFSFLLYCFKPIQIGLTSKCSCPKNNACFSLKFLISLNQTSLCQSHYLNTMKQPWCQTFAPKPNQWIAIMIYTYSLQNLAISRKNHTKVWLDFSFFHSHSPSVHSVTPAFSA